MALNKSHCPNCGNRKFSAHGKFYSLQAIKTDGGLDDRQLLVKATVCDDCRLIQMFMVPDDTGAARYINRQS